MALQEEQLVHDARQQIQEQVKARIKEGVSPMLMALLLIESATALLISGSSVGDAQTIFRRHADRLGRLKKRGH